MSVSVALFLIFVSLFALAYVGAIAGMLGLALYDAAVAALRKATLRWS